MGPRHVPRHQLWLSWCPTVEVRVPHLCRRLEGRQSTWLGQAVLGAAQSTWEAGPIDAVGTWAHHSHRGSLSSPLSPLSPSLSTTGWFFRCWHRERRWEGSQRSTPGLCTPMAMFTRASGHRILLMGRGNPGRARGILASSNFPILSTRPTARQQNTSWCQASTEPQQATVPTLMDYMSFLNFSNPLSDCPFGKHQFPQPGRAPTITPMGCELRASADKCSKELLRLCHGHGWTPSNDPFEPFQPITSA